MHELTLDNKQVSFPALIYASYCKIMSIQLFMVHQLMLTVTVFDFNTDEMNMNQH